MHNADYTPTVNAGSITPQVQQQQQQIQVLFAPEQEENSSSFVDRKLGDIFNEKIARKEYFYGLELTAHVFPTPAGEQQKPKPILDYNIFGAVLPLFTSIVWLGQYYAQVKNIAEVEAIRMAKTLQPKTIALPHFTSYDVDRERLREFLDVNFSNILAIRGDQIADKQKYKHAIDLVVDIKAMRGDNISIGVGGYPDKHPDSLSLDDDMKYLADKVNAGADYIITQVCFSSQTIIDFVRRCRAFGIKVPIIIGIFVPENMRLLQVMSTITKVELPPEQWNQYKKLSDDPKEFRHYAIQNAVKMISEVFDADIGIYGLHFFSLNRFKCVRKVINEIGGKYFQK